MYIDEKLKAVKVKQGSEFEECIFVKININSRDKLLVGLMYRSPTCNTVNNTKLDERMKSLSATEYTQILLMRDYNYSTQA